VQQINKQKDHLQITMLSSSDKTVPPNESLTDMVIIATGIKPEIHLAQAAGIHLGPTGGIKINQRAETNLKNIYAAGDCTEVTTSITGEPMISGLGTTAARHGLIAGTNAAGGNEILPKILNTSILKLWGMEIASTGITEEHALNRQLTNKLRPLSLLVKHKSLPHYYPGGVDVWVKLIALSGSGQLIGAQLAGETILSGRINLLALAIAKGLTINELVQSDFCYAPPCNDIWDPVIVAAKGLQQRILRNA